MDRPGYRQIAAALTLMTAAGISGAADLTEQRREAATAAQTLMQNLASTLKQEIQQNGAVSIKYPVSRM